MFHVAAVYTCSITVCFWYDSGHSPDITKAHLIKKGVMLIYTHLRATPGEYIGSKMQNITFVMQRKDGNTTVRTQNSIKAQQWWVTMCFLMYAGNLFLGSPHLSRHQNLATWQIRIYEAKSHNYTNWIIVKLNYDLYLDCNCWVF